MAFLNRFQWATVFGATSRRLACTPETEAQSPSNAAKCKCKYADRPVYKDSGTQTFDESVPTLNDEEVGGIEQTSESSLNEGSDEVQYGGCGCENVFETIDELSVREELYVRIHDEVEEDFTAGPSRLVLATDGIKEDCPALLMTLPLSGLVQQAIYAERQFARAERLETDTRVQLMRLESKVKREIRAHEYRLTQEKSSVSTTSLTAPEAAAKELENLRLLLADIGRRKQTATAQLETEAMLLHTCTRALADCLEDAFIAAEIIQPEELVLDVDVEPLDLKQEYQAFCEQLREMEEGSQASSVAALNVTGDTYMRVSQPVLTPEEQAELDLKNAFYDARDRMQNAVFEFDRRKTARDEEQQTTDEDEQAFDLRWVQRMRDLTREVIDAEENFTAAKTAAKDAGLNLTLEYQSSGFADVEGDGECISSGEKLFGPVRIAKISAWLGEVDEDVSSETASSADLDDWEASDVEMCDSVSCVAYGPSRKKIDGWQGGLPPVQ